MKRVPQYPTFREWCIGEIAQMFGYTDPMDRSRGLLHGDRPIKEGELVVICSAPNSIWGFSWVHEVGNAAHGEYCLRAVGTSELCNWTNISVTPFQRERYEGRDDLAWWPHQYDFWIKLRKAYARAGIDRYDFSLIYPKFNDDEATIGFRCQPARAELERDQPPRAEGRISRYRAPLCPGDERARCRRGGMCCEGRDLNPCVRRAPSYSSCPQAQNKQNKI